jgi:hypothetical protein
VLIPLVVAGAAVVLVAIGLPIVDRKLAALAERKASEYLSEPFGHPSTVRLHATPFLTQALRGCYRHVEVVGGLRIGDIGGATLVAHLTNAYLPIRALLGRRATERVTGRLVLPYDGLARLARIPGLSLAFEGERLLASASLPIPGISELARVLGEAVLSLHGGGSVWLRFHGVSVAGITLPSLVLSQLLPTLTVPVPIPPLPYGLRIDEVCPTASGLVVDGSADAVVFGRPGRRGR